MDDGSSENQEDARADWLTHPGTAKMRSGFDAAIAAAKDTLLSVAAVSTDPAVQRVFGAIHALQSMQSTYMPLRKKADSGR